MAFTENDTRNFCDSCQNVNLLYLCHLLKCYTFNIFVIFCINRWKCHLTFSGRFYVYQKPVFDIFQKPVKMLFSTYLSHLWQTTCQNVTFNFVFISLTFRIQFFTILWHLSRSHFWQVWRMSETCKMVVFDVLQLLYLCDICQKFAKMLFLRCLCYLSTFYLSRFSDICQNTVRMLFLTFSYSYNSISLEY